MHNMEHNKYKNKKNIVVHAPQTHMKEGRKKNVY